MALVTDHEIERKAEEIILKELPEYRHYTKANERRRIARTMRIFFREQLDKITL
jgi:hypothetical protein